MKHPKKVLCFSFLLALTFTGGMGPAGAEPNDDASRDAGGGFVPVPEEYYDPIEFSACDTTIILTSGDVREVEMQEGVKRDGTTVVRFRGDFTVDLLRTSDGASIDELDISGAVTERFSPDPPTLLTSLKGPSIVWPFSATEAEAFSEAGFPEFFYYEKGRLAIETEFSEDPAAVEPVSVDIVKNNIRHVQDVCEMLDDAAKKDAH